MLMLRSYLVLNMWGTGYFERVKACVGLHTGGRDLHPPPFLHNEGVIKSWWGYRTTHIASTPVPPILVVINREAVDKLLWGSLHCSTFPQGVFLCAGGRVDPGYKCSLNTTLGVNIRTALYSCWCRKGPYISMHSIMLFLARRGGQVQGSNLFCRIFDTEYPGMTVRYSFFDNLLFESGEERPVGISDKTSHTDRKPCTP